MPAIWKAIQSAESAKQHPASLRYAGQAAQGASPGNMNEKEIKPCKGGIDAFCIALTGLGCKLIPNPGFRLLCSLHPACGAKLQTKPRAVIFRAFSA